jgi:Domain of unknown function (DUF4279)
MVMSLTKRANRLGTFSMKSESQQFHTFATFRITGDTLVPAQITKFVGFAPTQAYAKGEHYSAGKRSANLLGKTGLWYLSTDKLVVSDRLQDHLDFLLQALLVPPYAQSSTQAIVRLSELRRLIERNSLRAVITCFWHGPARAKPPAAIARRLAIALKLFSIEIECDFDTDEELPTPVFAKA